MCAIACLFLSSCLLWGLWGCGKAPQPAATQVPSTAPATSAATEPTPETTQEPTAVPSLAYPLALGFESLQLQKISYNESSDAECVLILSADVFEGFCEDRKAELLLGEATAHIDAQKVKYDDAFSFPGRRLSCG